MHPGLFSPMWEAMHINSRALDHGELKEEERTNITNFIKSQCYLVPCGGCSQKAVLYYSKHIPNFKTGEDAWRWTVDFHNHVNRETGKREYSYDEAEKELNVRVQRDYQNLLLHEKHNRDHHKKIKSLQAELDLFKSIPHATTNDSLLKYIIAILAIVIAMLFFLFIMFGVLSTQHKKIYSSSH